MLKLLRGDTTRNSGFFVRYTSHNDCPEGSGSKREGKEQQTTTHQNTSSLETGRGQKVNGEFLLPRWLWPSVFNTNQPTAQLGFFFLNDDLLAKQRISQCTEHNKNNLQFSRRCWEGRTSSNPLPRRNKTKPEGKDCCNEAVPSQNRPGGGAAKPHCPAAASPHTPLPASLCQGTPAAVVYVRSFTKPQLLHTPEGRLGVAKGCFETPGPPWSSTEPSPGTGTWHKLGVLRFEEASSVPCSLEQA